jgi:hypothetical protein
VYYSKEVVIVERNGKPFAVVISPEEYQLSRRGDGSAKKKSSPLRFCSFGSGGSPRQER